jgi:hypothetical protein
MIQTDYLFRESAGGTYNCRKIAGSDAWSIHAYGLAIDLNPSKNPHRLPLTHDYPAEFITTVEAIRTGNGRQVFSWGGRWSRPDAMHWQINCSPADLNTGLVYPTPPPIEEDEMFCKKGDTNRTVEHWQRIIIAINSALLPSRRYQAYDDEMVAAVKAVVGGTGLEIGPGQTAALTRIVGSLGESGTVDQVARDAAGQANQTLSRIKSVIG